MDHRQLHCCEVVECQLVEARRHRSALLQPADALLDHRPTLVRLPVKLDPAIVGPLVLATRDDGLDPVPPQPKADALIAVALVTGQLHRPATRPPALLRDADQVQDALALGGLVTLPAGDLGGQRQAVAVADQVDFRAETAAGAAESVVGRLTGRQIFFFAAPAAARLARTLVPSMQNRSESISPASVRCDCKRWMIRSSKPLSRIRQKRS